MSGKNSIPLAIRFNATEESIEEVTKHAAGSLSNSPVHGNEDSSWRKELGNFFGRKRSGSIDSTTSSIQSSVTMPSASPSVTLNESSSSGGTWKLIKGKVKEAMDDIKAAKQHDSPVNKLNKSINTNQASDIICDDSDIESNTINSSISDDFHEAINSYSQQQKDKHANNTDSDSDIDADILLGNKDRDDISSSDKQRGGVGLNNKQQKSISSGKSINTKDTLLSKFNRRKEEWRSSTRSSTGSSNSSSGGSGSGGGGGSVGGGSNRTSLLRHRKKDGIIIPPTKPIKDIEIESGVEITEELSNELLNDNNNNRELNETNDGGGDEILYNNDNIENFIKTDENNTNNNCDNKNNDFIVDEANLLVLKKQNKEINIRKSLLLIIKYIFFKKTYKNIYYYRTITFGLTSLIICWLFALPPFLHGVLFTLFIIMSLQTLYEFIIRFIDKNFINNTNVNQIKAERAKFMIPDYGSMPICEIPAAEEHKQLKSYSGWMNEITNYDPSNYHISMTKSVFLKLDGSILRISNTNSRIAKRVTWNEKIIDRKTITFTKHRLYNLIDCKVELCPRGLARKRYFSRKYPIQLTIKNTKKSQNNVKTEFDSMVDYLTKLQNIDIDNISIKSMSGSGGGSAGITISHQNSNESVEDMPKIEKNIDLDFGSTILNSDLQKLHENLDNSNNVNKSDNSLTPPPIPPCGDDIRILLFARCDREKEDWYRRFHAASIGLISEQEFQFNDLVIVSDNEIEAAQKAAAAAITSTQQSDTTVKVKNHSQQKSPSSDDDDQEVTVVQVYGDFDKIVIEKDTADNIDNINVSNNNNNNGNQQPQQQQQIVESIFEGLLMSNCAARSPAEYIKFMSIYQKACSKVSPIPVINSDTMTKRSRREKKLEDELWKGIDQSLYLGPCGSVVWANVFIGRILFSCLNDTQLLDHIQEFLQKKLSSIKLPNFMEEVIIAQVNLGDTPPLIHRVSQPLIDERGTWIDADITYEGLVHMTITTKLNLLRLKKQQPQQQQQQQQPLPPPPSSSPPIILSDLSQTLNNSIGSNSGAVSTSSNNQMNILNTSSSTLQTSAIYDSNAESSGASSSESESPSNTENIAETQHVGPGSSRKFLRIVDRITTSNLFQSATEISYIQKAMENMSTKIRLRVELKGLVARIVINIPPPPSDRIWIGFRGPPRLWISATPALGDHTFDWTMVTSTIENKLCEEVTKYLVYPNMVDIIVPFLGQSTYKE